MGTGLHALDRNNDYQATVIASTRDQLIQMEAASPPPPSEATSALVVLADQLLSMRAKGFALERLASTLTQSGINVAIDELDAFLQHSMLARMYACEAKVEEYGRRGHVRSSERSAFIERGLRRALETELTSRVVYGHLMAVDFKRRVSAEPVDRLVPVRRP